MVFLCVCVRVVFSSDKKEQLVIEEGFVFQIDHQNFKLNWPNVEKFTKNVVRLSG